MPVDRGTIEQQLHALGESPRWWEQRELRDLPAALHADEQILAIARGKLARLRVLGRSWLIVVTDKRLLCLQAGSGISRRQMEVAAGQITRVSLGVGVFRGRIFIVAGGDKYRLLLKRPDAYKLLHVLSTLVQPREEPTEGFWANRMAGRVIRHVLDLPTVALQPGETPKLGPGPTVVANNGDLEQRMQLLEDQVQQLQQQVDFLEQLLRQRELILNPSHHASHE